MKIEGDKIVIESRSEIEHVQLALQEYREHHGKDLSEGINKELEDVADALVGLWYCW